jgi:hypothetical protein
MSKPIIAIPRVAPEEVEQLTELRQSVRRVHKSVPARSPTRLASADLSSRLRQLHRRGVPLHTLADLVGLSHQAVRVRVRSAAGAEGAVRSGRPARRVIPPSAPKLSSPAEGLVLVADAGVHRRLHVFDPPEDAGSAYLAMIPSIPMLEEREAIVAWLESESTSDATKKSSVTATRLRVPPAIYIPREIVDSVLVPLTTEESRSGDAARSSSSA